MILLTSISIPTRPDHLVVGDEVAEALAQGAVIPGNPALLGQAGLANKL